MQTKHPAQKSQKKNNEINIRKAEGKVQKNNLMSQKIESQQNKNPKGLKANSKIDKFIALIQKNFKGKYIQNNNKEELTYREN